MITHPLPVSQKGWKMANLGSFFFFFEFYSKTIARRTITLERLFDEHNIL